MSQRRYAEKIDAGRTVIHSGPADGCDYTLCGAAMDGEDGDNEMSEVARGKIDCERCVRIIRFCKQIPARILKP